MRDPLVTGVSSTRRARRPGAAPRWTRSAGVATNARFGLVRLLVLFAWVATARTAGALPSPNPLDAEQVVHLLEYVGSDYGGAVSRGVVVNARELAEQLEVLAEAGRVSRRLARPGASSTFDPVVAVGRITHLVETHAAEDDVAAAVKAITSELTAHYQLVQAPLVPPDRSRGRALFEQHCATCHGPEGRGDTQRALQYNPRPANFHDPAIARPLSPRRVFSTARFGVPNTAMVPFDFLSDAERWDIAFYASELDHAPPRGRTEATRMFALADLAVESDDELRDDLRAAGLATEAIEDSLAELRLHAPYEQNHSDGDNAALVMHARMALRKVAALLIRGEHEQAKLAVLGVYLDDIEPIEAPLRAADPALTLAIETRFKEARALIEAFAPKAQIDAKLDELMSDLAKAGRALEGTGGPPSFVTTMLTSAGIALREGTEAALLIAALLAVVAQAGGSRKRWVHVGWVTATLAGALTWLASRKLIAMSGLGREMLEGVSGLLAAAVLFYVSYWLFAKRETARWIAYLRNNAKSKQAAFSLWGISFLAVYREAFETVIFYQALVTQPGTGPAAGAGVLLGCVLLVGLVVGYGRAGKFAPPRSFFAFSSVLLYALAVVFAGQGLAALQTTGHIPLHAVRLPSVPFLGVYATVETYAVQLLLLLLALVAWLVARAQRPAGGAARKDGMAASREGAKL